MSNMYEWITETWNPIGGECPINCGYCFVKAMKRFPGTASKYSGPPRLTGPWPKFKAGQKIFVCSCTDLFAMPPEMIGTVLEHCCRFPDAQYVFQTKVPSNVARWLPMMPAPSQRMIGTTIETDIGVAWLGRARAMGKLRIAGEKTFVTVEPIRQFSSDFADILAAIGPAFINIGADSKGSKLKEPTAAKVRQLIAKLEAAGIEVRQKPNLKRILEEKPL